MNLGNEVAAHRKDQQIHELLARIQALESAVAK